MDTIFSSVRSFVDEFSLSFAVVDAMLEMNLIFKMSLREMCDILRLIKIMFCYVVYFVGEQCLEIKKNMS